MIDDSWVFRQIDSVRIADMGSTRRHTSLDALATDRLPSWPHGEFEEPTEKVGKHIAIPIALIEKGVVDRLDVSIEGRPATILTTDQNIEACRSLLFHLIQKFKREAPELTTAGIRHLEDVCLEATAKPSTQRNAEPHPRPTELDPPVADRINKAVRDVRVTEAGIKILAQLSSLTETLSTHFMLIAAAPTDLRSKRVSIKFSFDFKDFVPNPSGPTPLLAPTRIDYTPTTFFESCSYHFELDLPPGLHITQATQDETSIPLDRPESRIHLTWPSVPGNAVRDTLLSQYRRIEIQITPAERGIRRVAALSTTLTLFFTLCALLELIFGFIVRDTFTVPSPSASVLLASQAILLSWLARPPENRLVASTLKPLRISIFADAVIIFCTASLLAVPLEPFLWKLGWLLAFLCSLAAFLFYMIWRSENPPMPSRKPEAQLGASCANSPTQEPSLEGQPREV